MINLASFALFWFVMPCLSFKFVVTSPFALDVSHFSYYVTVAYIRKLAGILVFSYLCP